MDRFEITLPSALFPFTREDLPSFEWGGYRMENVFEAIDPSRQQACVELWLLVGAITSPRAAWDRSRQVCYLMWHKDTGELAGLNTLYLDGPTGDTPACFVNRMFIRPDHRRSRLMIVATAATICYAKAELEGRARGVLNINENPKLARPGMRRIFGRLGYQPREPREGKDAWFFEFSRVELRRPPPSGRQDE